MPPEAADRLSDGQIATIRDWITAGAPWIDEPSTSVAKPGNASAWESAGPEGVEVATSGGQSDSWTHRKYQPADVWAYRPLRRQAIPQQGLDPADAAHPVDAFIRSRFAGVARSEAFAPGRKGHLAAASHIRSDRPAADAARARRLLGGRTPQAGSQGARPVAGGPHYGEQMARLWLDVVRYSDTSGFSNDYERPHAWRYRDYVVRSFNQDKPYDRFVTEQLAGDELDPQTPKCSSPRDFCGWALGNIRP